MKKKRPSPRKILEKITRYEGGAEPPAIAGAAKLSSNESPLGASAAAREAYMREAEKLALYPDGDAAALRKALSIKHQIDAEQIVCGAGSDEILSLLAQIFLEPQDEAIHTQHGFLFYAVAIRAAGGIPISVEETNLKADGDKILKAVTPKTKMVFLANPNNPTSSCLSEGEIRKLHQALPPHILLVIDAAYAEYVERDDDFAGMALVQESENVVVTRTFSKIYGLAGLRLGWAYAPRTIAEIMNKVRGPFNVSRPALAAGVAACGDEAHLQKARRHAIEARRFLREEAQRLGLEVPETQTNFILMRFPKGQSQAQRAHRFLEEKGFMLRKMDVYDIPDALRASVGMQETNLRLIAALREFLKAEQ